MHFLPRLLKALAALLTIAVSSSSLPLHAFTPTTDGLYAVFNTNMGTFAAKLHYDKAPLTVANFVALAEGTQPWLDFNNGTVHKRPYYDGLTFHRVISGFMLQTGSRSGDGRDGPGYRFPDEMHPDLTHSKAGILSMANSATPEGVRIPNTNGGQFFVTLAATQWLDYKHAVFGEIVDGMAVVTAIGAVATNSLDSPLEAVRINSIQIIRQGQQANNFKPSDLPLPQIETKTPWFHASDPNLWLRVNRTALGETFLYSSNNLNNWSHYAGDINDNLFQVDIRPDLDSSSQLFFKSAFSPYPSFSDQNGGKLIIRNGLDLDISFGPDSLGTYALGTTPGEVTSYEWFNLGQYSQLYIAFSGLRTMQIYLDYETATTGNALVHVFADNTNTQNPHAFSITATFTYTAP